jgi:hypothetical protein
MTPHPAVSDTHAARALADRAVALAGREKRGRMVLKVGRLPVMNTHDSLTPLTWE